MIPRDPKHDTYGQRTVRILIVAVCMVILLHTWVSRLFECGHLSACPTTVTINTRP